MRDSALRFLLAVALLLGCHGCSGGLGGSNESQPKIVTKRDTTTTDKKDTSTRFKVIRTTEDFQSSSLFRQFSWKLVRRWPGYRVYIDSTLAYVVVLQTAKNGSITAFRISASSEEPDRVQKKQLFAFLTDLVYGDGASSDDTVMSQVDSTLVAHLSESNVNRFNMNDVDVGFLQTPSGHMRGFQCDTSKARPWDIALSDNTEMFETIKKEVKGVTQILGQPSTEWAARAEEERDAELKLLKQQSIAADAQANAKQVWEQQQKDNLYSFLFNNGEPPVVSEPPKALATVTSFPGSIEPKETITPTKRLEALADARLTAGRPDPFSPITGFKSFPPSTAGVAVKSGKRLEYKTSEWLALVNGGPVGLPGVIPLPPTDLPVPNGPPVTSMPPNRLVAPPDPYAPVPHVGGSTASGGISISQLPLPPEKPMVAPTLTPIGRIDDRIILAVNPYKAIQNGWPRTIILGVGDQFESVRVIKVTSEEVTLDEDGNQVVLRLEI